MTMGRSRGNRRDNDERGKMRDDNGMTSQQEMMGKNVDRDEEDPSARDNDRG